MYTTQPDKWSYIRHHRPDLSAYESRGRCLMRSRNSLSFANILVHLRVSGGVRVAHRFDLDIFYCQIYTIGLNIGFTTDMEFSRFSSLCCLYVFYLPLLSGLCTMVSVALEVVPCFQ
jgi:hypothetical protein